MPPKIAEIKLTHFDGEVYEPAEDSFMLVDALVDDWPNIEKTSPTICLEIGSGTGYVICSAALLLQGSGVCFATDVNPRAAAATQATLAAHGVSAEVAIGDLFAGLQPRLSGQVDVLLFNPPYVPTPSEEVGRGGVSAAWAGGDKGREVIDRVLPQVNRLLSATGCLLMVLVQENDIEEVCQRLQESGLQSRVLLKRTADEEILFILKAWNSSLQ
ncbi:hypothetical protein CYMTET_17042 [Cymbomonas tetramitiformis]|uniref:Methyltransferase small domain-containing protein n=1 Tax=Cymbomonas tetramitiformis TaxID=36881 RepID=A0AAE0GAY5_9CHLO|nr:hypothetical protein CYMTET_17042 [Cymbomonas tetramitiformis]